MQLVLEHRHSLAQVGGYNPNPFVTVEFGGACVKTTPAYDVEQYTWNECARIPVQTPVYEDTILIKRPRQHS